MVLGSVALMYMNQVGLSACQQFMLKTLIYKIETVWAKTGKLHTHTLPPPLPHPSPLCVTINFKTIFITDPQFNFTAETYCTKPIEGLLSCQTKNAISGIECTLRGLI